MKMHGPKNNTRIKIHGTVILPVVLYGWEIWSLTLREERRLRVFENRVLRGITKCTAHPILSG